MESLLAVEWVSSVLTQDEMLASMLPGGWQEIPLQGTPSPWGRVQSIGQAADERADEGGQLIWARPTLLISVFDRWGNYSRIKAAAARVYFLLNGQHDIDTADGVMYSCIRDFASHAVEQAGNIEVRRIFQQYSFLAADADQPVVR